jgi:hypothetical protein
MDGVKTPQATAAQRRSIYRFLLVSRDDLKLLVRSLDTDQARRLLEVLVEHAKQCPRQTADPLVDDLLKDF